MMTEVRCQMCGKLNPADEEFCQFCHAKLVPISVDIGLSDDEIDKEILSTLDENEFLDEEPLKFDNNSTSSLRQEVQLSEGAKEEKRESDDEPSETDYRDEIDINSRINLTSNEDITTPEPRENLHAIADDEIEDVLNDIRNADGAYSENDGSSQQDSQDELNDALRTEPLSDENKEIDVFDFVSELKGGEAFSEVPGENQSEETEKPSEVPGIVNEQEKEESKIHSESMSETSDWLDDLSDKTPLSFEEKPTESDESEEETEDALSSDEFEDALPDWLVEALDESEGDIPEKERTDYIEQEEVIDLDQVEVPNWLKTQSAVAITELGREESIHQEIMTDGSGPLAGIDGILSAEPDLSIISEPVTHTAKLKVTETQRAQSEVFKKMIRKEGKAKPIPPRPVKTTHYILRLVIAIAIILSVLWAVYSGGLQTGLREGGAGVYGTRDIIESLPTDAVVLMAFDYEPNLSDEMDAVTAPVLDHLMAKGVNILIVSTVPTGGMQGEKLIQNLNQQFGYEYASGVSYANMGFIPGGSVGLQSFGDSPWQVLPLTLDGINISELPFMSNIHRISDFSMVIVATDKPETGKAWLEQVKPGIGNSPMVLLLSSQAAPLLQPYFGSGTSQVQGSIIGVAGGAEYENIYHRLNQANRYWSALNIGIFVAGLAIALGAVYSIGFGLFSRSSSKPDDGK